MRYRLEIESADLAAVRNVMDDYKTHPFVLARQMRNIVGRPPENTPPVFWTAQLMCLLTTQNKSGRGSAVDQFLNKRPFPLTWEVCESAQAVDALIYETLSRLGIRRWKISSGFAQENFRVLKNGGWERLENWNQCLLAQRTQAPVTDHYLLEREAAQDLQDLLMGIGPKQSRNFWQEVGMTRYEIPLDSRVMRWLNQSLNFYIPSGGLSDERYYSQVMDSVRDLALAAGILPCMLDAVVFSFYEKE